MKTPFTIALLLVKDPGLELTKKVQNSYEESNDTLLKLLKENLKTQREDFTFQEQKN